MPICLYRQGFIDLSFILQAVKCHAASSASDILPLSVVTADKGYGSEDNHILVREQLHAFSVIHARYRHVPIWKTSGKYRKQMKRCYCKALYNQRNKDETIISVIKRLFGEHITSRLVRTRNRELSLRCIAYNMHRVNNLIIILLVSTVPYEKNYYEAIKA